ncbi:MAG TPA: prolyl oligopeptidase family serine peptidase [Candidatus Limnocylindrales bacterium]|nr:prolyl oligopeptidase family serine peptidase [Candidatus Limnocylindrales bacterium]
MTPAIIRRQVVLEELDVAASGRFAIVARRFVDAQDRYASHLWLVPLVRGLGRTRALTGGAVHDGRPRISPDGSLVAFRRKRLDDKEAVPTLEILGLGGAAEAPNEPWTVVAPEHGVGELAWSPRGDRLAYTTEAGPARFLIASASRPAASADQAANRAPLGRRINRADWRWDEQGHVDHWEHLFVIRARRGARARQLTHGDWGVQQPSWDPSGRSIVFAADRSETADIWPRTTIWRVGVDGDEPTELLRLGGPASRPVISPDGRWLAAVGVTAPDPLDDLSPTIVVAAADGSGAASELAPDLDRPVGSWVDTDLHGWQASSRGGPSWAGSDALVALVSDHGRCLPWRFTIDSATGRGAGSPRPLATGDAACDHLAIAAGGRRVVVVGTLDARAPEVMTVEGGGLRTRTSIGSAWQSAVAQPEMRLIQAPGPGGPIDVWMASPPDAGMRALPTVIDIHGGPLGAWTAAPSLEVSLLVARGYRVLLPNIRGSATYGREWIRPQLGDWGGVDAEDVLATLDQAVATGWADPARVGLLGLSYGGFMVNWLVGTSARFAAAVSENGVTNQVNAWANSDSGPDYSRTSLLGDPLSEAGMLKLWRQSPLAHVADVRTPLLILQAEADERCPKADNEQLFVALRARGRTVEYVLYPEEYHVYQAAGRVDRRIDRMTRMLDWFDRFLVG